MSEASEASGSGRVGEWEWESGSVGVGEWECVILHLSEWDFTFE